MPGCRIAPADALRTVVDLLDRAAEHDAPATAPQPAVLIRLDRLPQTSDDELQFALRRLPLGVHPLEELDGFVAPPTWAGAGVIVTGKARHADNPGVVLGRARTIVLVTREGLLASGLRIGDGDLRVDVMPAGEGVTGEVPLALCRALGVPLRHGTPTGERE